MSHRGDNRNFPENTLEAFESAIALGATHIETDIRTTADGRLVCFHDGTLERTTNGTGRVRAYTLAEIQQLDAGSWFAPQFAGLRVPSIAEVYALAARTNTSLYVDLKDGTAANLYAELVAAGLQARAVIYSGPVRLKELQTLDPVVRVMPQAVGVRVLSRSIEFFAPLTAVNFGNELIPDAVVLAQEIGADIFVNRFGANDVPASYQAVIDGGATGIQVDNIGQLVEFLRSNGYYP